MNPTQKNRPISIKTALGDDAFLLNRFTLREQISGLFQIEADLAAVDAKADFDKVVGNAATISLSLGKNGIRFFNGYVSRLVLAGNVGQYPRYHATIVPWPWFLTRTSDCRVFQRKSVLDIAEDVFNAQRFGADFYELGTSGKYAKRRYCVQYRETDFNFISRLLEGEGIYYWFDHKDGSHKLVLADRIGASKPTPGYETLEFKEAQKSYVKDQEIITSWSVEKEVQTVAYNLKDYDFKNPNAPLPGKGEIAQKHGMARFALYDYPGDYFDPSQGDPYAKIRLEELQSKFELVHGVTTALGLRAGGVFTMKSHPLDDQNRKYLITELHLTADSGEFASQAGGGGQFFECSFTAIPADTQFRPARVTPKPVIQGVQTATVVGPKGDEIHTDKYGRVKVQFHWDRYGKADENSSCWVRVSQGWAGKNWGAIYIPRIGQEVIVEFLEGDADRPIITGRVYNAESMPPYTLPDEKTKSTLKSNSTKGGDGFNEIRFEDKKGSEQIFMHGEKNLDIRIKNDAFEFIGNNRHLVVTKDQFEHVENNRNETVDADHKEKIGKDRHLNVAGKEAKEVVGSQSLSVTGDVIEVFKANHSEQTTNDYYLKADNIVIEGMTSITIKVGQSSIAMDASGVTIAAGQIQVNGQSTVTVKSPNTTVKGDATLTLKGGMTMIN